MSAKAEKKERLLFWLRTLGACLAGSVLLAVGLNQFLVPAGFAQGGISGIAVIIYNVTNGWVPIGVCTVLINIPLFILGYRKVGRRFILGSLIGTLLSSAVIDGLAFTVKYWTMPQEDPILLSIGGGVLIGLGYGLIFRVGASTGGTDILARLIQRKKNYFSLGQICLALDVFFLIIMAVVYRSVIPAMYTGIVVFVSSKVVDAVEGGLDYAKEVFVVSDFAEQIGEAVTGELNRGATVLHGDGVYSGTERKILWCVVYNRQLPQLREIVNRYDPMSFMAIRNVREVNGLYEGETRDLPNAKDDKR